jgi:repressor LexA
MSKQSVTQLNGPYNVVIQKRMKQMGFQKIEDFANYADIGATTVYNLVLGRQTSSGNWMKPSIDVLFKLEKALEIPASELLEMLRETNQEVSINFNQFIGIHPSETKGIDFQREFRVE